MKHLENYRSFKEFLTDWTLENPFNVTLDGDVIGFKNKQQLLDEMFICHNRLIEKHVFYNSASLLRKEIKSLQPKVFDASLTLEERQHVDGIIKFLNDRLNSGELSSTYTCKFSEKEAQIHLDRLIEQKQDVRRLEILESIKFDNSMEMLKIFDIYGIKDVLSKKVFLQWMCNVKRYLLNRKVEWNLCPILYSPVHGNGKTHLVSVLTSIFDNGHSREGVQNKNFSYLLNQFNLASIFKSYVVVLDEMTGFSKKDDLNEFKRLVDVQEDWIRGIHEKGATLVKRHFSFIGTSNTDMMEYLKDDSSNRRFFQITIDRKDNSRNELDSINPFSLYKSIDENVDYITEKDIQSIKEQKVQHDIENNPLDMFLNEKEVTPGNNSFMSLGDFVESFLSYVDDNKLVKKYTTSTKIKSELEKRQFLIGRFNRPENQQLYIKIS